MPGKAELGLGHEKNGPPAAFSSRHSQDALLQPLSACQTRWRKAQAIARYFGNRADGLRLTGAGRMMTAQA
jgi:hypothetical protein